MKKVLSNCFQYLLLCKEVKRLKVTVLKIFLFHCCCYKISQSVCHLYPFSSLFKYLRVNQGTYSKTGSLHVLHFDRLWSLLVYVLIFLKVSRTNSQLILRQCQLQRKSSNTDTRWRCVATMDAETWREFFAASKGDLQFHSQTYNHTDQALTKKKSSSCHLPESGCSSQLFRILGRN